MISSMLIGILVGLLGGVFLFSWARIGFLGAMWTVTIGFPMTIVLFVHQEISNAIERRKKQ
jgi:hypothetical protein